MSAFDGLEPKAFWQHFEALTQIPRCSGSETRVALHVMNWAKSQGFTAHQDATGNVFVAVPASPGCENAPKVILQGHLDMVGEKDSCSSHNFATDAIPVLRKGDWICADHTTLGADNGVSIAAAQAIAEDPNAVHGPLEFLFTVDEERGLTGAKGLSNDSLTGRILLNLDSEEEGDFCVGCAGGVDTTIDLPIDREPSDGYGFSLKITGLQGGHSGMDINLGRGNAIKILARALDLLRNKGPFALHSFQSGDKHNAIPREGSAVLVFSEAHPDVEGVLEMLRDELHADYAKTDPGVTVIFEPCEIQGPIWTLAESSRNRVIDLLCALPHGVLTMSQAVPGLVETSTNLAKVELQADHLHVHESSRSSSAPRLESARTALISLANLCGAVGHSEVGYPGWQPNLDSPVLKLACATYRDLFHKDAHVKAIHAGLECGLIGERFPGMDMISFGPDVEWPHSPSERLSIPSVDRYYRFLCSLLERLAARA